MEDAWQGYRVYCAHLASDAAIRRYSSRYFPRHYVVQIISIKVERGCVYWFANLQDEVALALPLWSRHTLAVLSC